MDGHQFDALARALARPARRRSLVLGVAGGVAALLGVAMRGQPAGERQGSFLN